MKIGICNENLSMRTAIKELLLRLLEGENAYTICMYTSNEIQIDLKDGCFDCAIILLNTEYPKGNIDGVTLAKKINQAYPFCKIIYVSENENAIKEIYETKHCYFVRRKDMQQVLPQALQKARTMIAYELEHTTFEIICEGHPVYIKHSDLLYIEKCGRLTKIVTRYREYSCYKSLISIQHQLEHILVRVHGGYLVNLTFITYLGIDFVELQNGIRIPLGRTYDKNVRKRYLEYWKEKI